MSLIMSLDHQSSWMSLLLVTHVPRGLGQVSTRDVSSAVDPIGPVHSTSDITNQLKVESGKPAENRALLTSSLRSQTPRCSELSRRGIQPDGESVPWGPGRMYWPGPGPL